MNRLTRFSMKNIAAVLIMIMLLAGGGIYAASTLKVESLPDVTLPYVAVTTQYAVPPEDVLEKVTKPLEKAFAGLEGLKHLSSSSSDNFSRIIIELKHGIDPEDAKEDVASLIANVELPPQADKPRVTTTGFATTPIYYLALYGKNGTGQEELDRIYKDTILPNLNAIIGIDRVESIGNQEYAVTVKLDADALQSFGLTPAQVTQYIRDSLLSGPSGTVELNGDTQMVRVKGEFNTIFQLENMEIPVSDQRILLLGQIAKVEAKQESKFIARFNEQPAIGLILYKSKSTNAVEFADAVDNLLEKWKTSQPYVDFHIVANRATDIKQSIHGMFQEGVLGAILASIMILLFLRNLRMTLIVLVSIPLSLIMTLLCMAPLGVSLNIMTLGGMVIAIGRVVDDSIVVIENIYSNLLKAQERNESVIILATQQVAMAITSSTLTTVGVFAPIAFVSGIVGDVFRPFALTIVCALLSSLLVAVTIIPMLVKLLVLVNNDVSYQEHGVGKMGSLYQRVLVWSLRHRIKTLLVAALCFVLSLTWVAPSLPVSFMPDSGTDTLVQLKLEMPTATSFDTMNSKTAEIEGMLREAKDESGEPRFTFVESLVGYNEGEEERNPNKAMIYCELANADDAKQFLQMLKENIMYQMPKGSQVEAILLSSEGGGETAAPDFDYVLKGDDLTLLHQASIQVKEKMKEFPELYEIKDSLGESKTEVEIVVDQAKAREYGLNVAQVYSIVRSFLAREDLGEIRFDNILSRTRIELDQPFKDSLQSIGEFAITTPTGKTVDLQDIAKIREVQAPSVITRDMQVQTVHVTAKINHQDKGGVSEKLASALGELTYPAGVTQEVKGITDDINDGFMQMFVAMGASIFIVYLIMVLAFGNASAPFSILFSLPLAVIGGLLGLYVAQESINITTLTGFLMLIGIVVTNAIVLIDRVNQMRNQGYEVREALIQSGVSRLRPIIMTAGATIIALLPLAFGMSQGTLISKGLAVVVIGGLTTSTLLTLVVVPIVYQLIYAFQTRISRIFDRSARSEKGEHAI